jgi:hypothetical protein
MERETRALVDAEQILIIGDEDVNFCAWVFLFDEGETIEKVERSF